MYGLNSHVLVDYRGIVFISGYRNRKSIATRWCTCLNKTGTHHKPIHRLLHSLASHILEQETTLRLVQKLLGYNSFKTTEIYNDISNKSIAKKKNPADDFLIRKIKMIVKNPLLLSHQIADIIKKMTHTLAIMHMNDSKQHKIIYLKLK